MKLDFGRWWYELDQRFKVLLVAAAALIGIGLCVVVVLVATSLVRSSFAPQATTTTTPVPPSPTTPPPTPKPTPTATPPPPTEVSPLPPPPTEVDPQGDVGTYDAGTPVEQFPGSIDIRAASVSADRHIALQPAGDAPAELADWVAEGEVLLWIMPYEPIPDPPTSYTEWLFALDLDGDAATGRPEGKKGRIDPDIGMDAAVAVYYDPQRNAYTTYCLVWNTAQATWAAGPAVRYNLGESRTLVALAVSQKALTEAAAQAAGIAVVPEAVRGRAGAWARVEGQKVIDFYPDLP